ncbi:GldG family protein [Dyella sp.]|uniref:GldG family protein n=1 Tax=Dyella sp. TaxID=1869338 RepID=UPI002D78F50F|nr:DUF4350 domain-containing protein [Dyella sp.]HET6432002.1 DUF4350 domain-containing protein [Dyella sp.]
MHRTLRRLDGWLIALLLLAATAAAAYLSVRYQYVADWTHGGRASLSRESRAVLAQLDGPVEIVSYASPQGSLRQTIANFVQRYQRVKPDITLRFVDPQLDPGAMRELGITVDGELLIHYKGHEQRLDDLSSEGPMSNALERLARGGERIVAFVSGDGERRADGQANADMGTFIAQLESRGMRAVPLNFAQVSAVPQHTDLVVLASPTAALAPGGVKELVDYVRDGGNLLWLTEPARDAALQDPLGLRPLAELLGIGALPGVLTDRSAAALGLNDPHMLALGDYPAHAITRGLTLTTLFPEVAALAPLSRSDWSVTPFLRSGPQGRVEVGNQSDTLPGRPLEFGFALTRLSPSPDKSEQRAVVIGDGDFLSNTYLGNGGNRALGERVFDWLLGDDALVNLPPRGAPDRFLRLSQGELNAASLGFLAGLPLLLLALGGWIVWRRRRR